MSLVTDIWLLVISMETFNSAYCSTHVEVQAAHFCCSHRQLLSCREAQQEDPDQRKDDVIDFSEEIKLL